MTDTDRIEHESFDEADDDLLDDWDEYSEDDGQIEYEDFLDWLNDQV